MSGVVAEVFGGGLSAPDLRVGSAAGAARTRLSNRWTERGAAVACCHTRRPAVGEPALRADPHAVGPRRRGCSSRLRKGLCRGPESNTDGIHAAVRMQMHEPRPIRNPGRSGLNGVCAFLSEKSCVLGTPAGGRHPVSPNIGIFRRFAKFPARSARFSPGRTSSRGAALPKRRRKSRNISYLCPRSVPRRPCACRRFRQIRKGATDE